MEDAPVKEAAPVGSEPRAEVPVPPAAVPPPPPAQPFQPQRTLPARPAAQAVPPNGRGSRPGMPTWLMGLLFALGFLALGFGVYYGIQSLSNRPSAAATASVNNSLARTNKVSNPLQKYIEVIGIRLMQDSSRRPQARFVVVNHSTTELSDLNANVTLWASSAKAEEEPVGTFQFKVGRLGPNESKELTGPFKTKLKIYEFPDWQNLTADVQVTAQ